MSISSSSTVDCYVAKYFSRRSVHDAKHFCFYIFFAFCKLSEAFVPNHCEEHELKPMVSKYIYLYIIYMLYIYFCTVVTTTETARK